MLFNYTFEPVLKEFLALVANTSVTEPTLAALSASNCLISFFFLVESFTTWPLTNFFVSASLGRPGSVTLTNANSWVALLSGFGLDTAGVRTCFGFGIAFGECCEPPSLFGERCPRLNGTRQPR